MTKKVTISVELLHTIIKYVEDVEGSFDGEWGKLSFASRTRGRW